MGIWSSGVCLDALRRQSRRQYRCALQDRYLSRYTEMPDSFGDSGDNVAAVLEPEASPGPANAPPSPGNCHARKAAWAPVLTWQLGQFPGPRNLHWWLKPHTMPTGNCLLVPYSLTCPYGDL